MISLIEKLIKCGLPNKMLDNSISSNNQFSNQVWVITGSFDNYKPRSKAAEIIEKYAGKITNSISGQTTHLLVGANAGSKLEKAKKYDIKVIDEKMFIEMIKKNE